MAVDPGFNMDGVLTASINLPRARYGDDDKLRAFTDEALRRLRALPGVSAAGATDTIPFGSNNSDSVIIAEGYQMQPRRVGHLAESSGSDAGIFRGDGRQADSRPLLRRARRAEGPADGHRGREAREALLAEPGSDWTADVPASGHQQPAGGDRQDRLPLRRRRDRRHQAARADRGQADRRRVLLSDGAEHVERDDVRGEDSRRSAGALEQRPGARCPSSIASCRCTTFRRWMRGWRSRW